MGGLLSLVTPAFNVAQVQGWKDSDQWWTVDR